MRVWVHVYRGESDFCTEGEVDTRMHRDLEKQNDNDVTFN